MARGAYEVRVVNLRTWGGGGAYSVAHGRALGNPYKMQDGSEAERDRVMAGFESHLDQQMDRQSGIVYNTFNNLMRELRTRGRLVLGCMCFPERCHAEIIAEKLLDGVHEQTGAVGTRR